MNHKVVLKVVGRVLLMVGCSMFIPLFVALYYKEDISPYLCSITITLFAAAILSSIKASTDFHIREGFLTVALIWVSTVFVGSFPFYFSDLFPSFIDCLFESCSGFTTTGTTILTDIEAMPKSILFWRSFTHMLGGMGVLVLATAIIPTIGIRTKYLTQAESTGPMVSKLVPKQSQSSKILYFIYCGLFALEVICLRVAGMPWYDSFLHAFSSAGTGGFSNMSASITAYNNVAVEMIIAIFVFLFSINFAMHFLLLTRNFKDVFKSDELRFFITIVAVVTAIIMINIRPLYTNWSETFRYAFFQVTSVISTAGFVTVNWLEWPQICQVILILLMFCGGCAGSTCGGIKVGRVLIMLKAIKREINHIIHPRSVQVIKLDGKVVDDKTIHSILVFIGCYLLIMLGATAIVSLDGFTFEESFSTALICTSNAGPGLGIFGPDGNHSVLSDFSKIAMSVVMLVGRLEIFPVLVLLTPSAWTKD